VAGEIRDECGVFGIFGHPSALEIAYRGLFSLQHRGQESAGLAWLKDGDVTVSKGMGLVAEVFGKLPVPDGGSDVVTAIGHVRYSTTGTSTVDNAQPLVARTRFGPLALAHNGNLTNHQALRQHLEQGGSLFQTTSDTEVLAHLIARQASPELAAALLAAARELEGGFAYLILTREVMAGLRDPHGIRPLVLGTLAGAFVLASETCALDAVGADMLREVSPGELVVIDADGLRSYWPWGQKEVPEAFCAFEMVYFSRPDSRFRGTSVHATRRAMGRELAREHPADADLVVGVPDSSLPAAMGYAEAAGLPFDIGLVKNRYVGRSFIQPGQSQRDTAVTQKLAAVRSVVEGKRVALVDDSLVRGTTSRHLVQLLRQAGATAVHMRIASPPYKRACHYGIDTSRSHELAAARYELDAIRSLTGADTLGYLSIEGLQRALGDGGWCLACFGTGYPVPVPAVREVTS
jgi:amidophosphoribosyltransferase